MDTALNAKDTETMDFETFVETVRGHLQEHYPGYEVRTTPVLKNNDVRRTGICVLPDGGAVVPTIYMESYYEEYLGGSPVDEIVSDYVRRREKVMAPGDIPLPDVTDFNAVKDIISCRLVNWKRNRGQLTEMPHRRFLNLAVTYYIPSTVKEPNDGKIDVTGRMASLWGVDEETLYRHALENTRRRLPVKIQTMEEMVREIMGESYPEGLFGSRDGIPCPPVFVLRRAEGGESTAAALLDEDVLRKFAGEHGDFYILPSSIFEVLLVPEKHGKQDAAYYKGMVREVNRSSLKEDEILADNAYYYHADSGRLEVLH